MRLSPLAVLLAAAVASGCAGSHAAGDLGSAEGYPNHLREDVLARTAAAAASVHSLSSDGRLEIDTPALRERVTFSLRTRFRDSLTVVVRGPLGIEGGRALLSRDTLIVVERLNRSAFVGSPALIRRLVPGTTTAEDIARAFAGLTVPETHLPWALTAENGLYRLSADLPGGSRREIDVDPRFWGVVGVRVFDEAGALLGETRASDHARVDAPGGGIVLPHRVDLLAQGGRLTFEHRALVANPRVALARVVPPADYPVLPLAALIVRED